MQEEFDKSTVLTNYLQVSGVRNEKPQEAKELLNTETESQNLSIY